MAVLKRKFTIILSLCNIIHDIYNVKQFMMLFALEMKFFPILFRILQILFLILRSLISKFLGREFMVGGFFFLNL